jgi:HEAT repeat protein
LIVPAFRIAVLGWLKNEPFYEGKPVSYWISQLEESLPETRLKAATAIRNIGPRARGAAPALSRLLDDESYSIRLNAISGLVCIGMDDPETVNTLVERLEHVDNEVRMETIQALDFLWMTRGASHAPSESVAVGLYDALIPSLQSALRDTQPYVRFEAAQILGMISSDCPAAREAIPELLELLNDKEPHHYPAFMQLLSPSLGHTRFNVYLGAFGALRKMGVDPPPR